MVVSSLTLAGMESDVPLLRVPIRADVDGVIRVGGTRATFAPAIAAFDASATPEEIVQPRYGGTRWRKLKGDATVRLVNGSVRRAEMHWYEAHGVGKRGLKIGSSAIRRRPAPDSRSAARALNAAINEGLHPRFSTTVAPRC